MFAYLTENKMTTTMIMMTNLCATEGSSLLACYAVLDYNKVTDVSEALRSAKTSVFLSRHDVTSHKSWTFTNTAVITSNFALFHIYETAPNCLKSDVELPEFCTTPASKTLHKLLVTSAYRMERTFQHYVLNMTLIKPNVKLSLYRPR